MSDTNKASDSKPKVRPKPYAPPKLVSYGHVKDIVQGVGGGKSDKGQTRT
jgi:hypothetical protein